MPRKAVAKKSAVECPGCGLKSIYLRKDGTGRCNKCGFDGPMPAKKAR